jgi:hypothetical protein
LVDEGAEHIVAPIHGIQQRRALDAALQRIARTLPHGMLQNLRGGQIPAAVGDQQNWHMGEFFARLRQGHIGVCRAVLLRQPICRLV